MVSARIGYRVPGIGQASRGGSRQVRRSFSEGGRPSRGIYHVRSLDSPGSSLSCGSRLILDAYKSARCRPGSLEATNGCIKKGRTLMPAPTSCHSEEQSDEESER